MLSSLRNLSLLSMGLLIFIPAWSEEESSSGRQIEQVVVYGERIQSTVSDTSISITAMSEDFLMDMGIQGPNEMVNFIPATTRTSWDIKIRGIGRNFRGLGGDPGVGTYYNGAYSPDFGIASTEGGLYDIQRIEVLRGPQGTLYGRNSIGGVVNYVTNPANHDEFESQIRFVGGQYNTSEAYAVVSGPLTDNLAYRFVGSKRTADGRIEGLGSSEDMEAVNDANFVLTLDWRINDTMTLNIRANDRESEAPRNFGNGGHGFLSEGPCISSTGSKITSIDQCDPLYRVSRDTNHWIKGLRPVSADDPAAKFPFIHPTTGESVWGAYKRPGVDPIGYPFMPSPNYGNANVAAYDGGSASDPSFKSLTNNFVNEIFDHNSATVVFDWDVSDLLAIKYLGSYQNFLYYYDRDNDHSDSLISSYGDTVDESVFSLSHELRFFWSAGDRWTGTSGLYYFQEDRDQLYGLRNRIPQVNNPTPYSPLVDAITGFKGGCFDYRSLPVNGPQSIGAWCGDPGRPGSITNDTGGVYEHDNNVVTTNKAIYTQADYQLTDTTYVTLGFRYSEDTRDAFEARGLRIEILYDDAVDTWVRPVLASVTGDAGYLGEGVTNTAAWNVAMGNATFTGDPLNPISPVCDLLDHTCATPLLTAGLPVGYGSRTSGKYETSNTSYRLNFNWEPTPDHLIYAGVTTSYRAGGFNMGGASNRAEVGGVSSLVFYDDEELTAFEIGFKSAFWDNRAQLTGAVYYYDYQDYQDHMVRWESNPPSFQMPGGVDLAISGRGPVEVTDNIPKAHNTGFEIDGLVLLTDALTIGGNYSYTESVYDTAYTVFNDSDPRYPADVMGGEVNQDPCTLAPEIAALYCLTVDGVQLPGIPKNKLTGWASYRWDLAQGTLTAYGSYAYTGEYFTHLFARPWDEVPERHRVDARLSFESVDNKWNASLFVDNILDKTYLRWSDMTDTGAGANFPHRGIALDPRYIGFEVVYNFL